MCPIFLSANLSSVLKKIYFLQKQTLEIFKNIKNTSELETKKKEIIKTSVKGMMMTYEFLEKFKKMDKTERNEFKQKNEDIAKKIKNFEEKNKKSSKKNKEYARS